MKILKKLLPGQNIESGANLIFAAAYVPQPVIDLKRRKRFTSPLIKPMILALTMIFAGLLFSGNAYATKWTVTALI